MFGLSRQGQHKSKSRIANALYLRREMARSIDAIPPPEIRRASDIASSDIGNSIPPGAKKLGQWTPMIADSMTQKTKKAPTLVSSPSKINTPPTSSATAAALIQSQAGRIKGKGAGNEVNLAKPGPLKLPNTFWAPCAIKTTPNANRKGTGTHDADVEINLLNIAKILSESETWKSVQDINKPGGTGKQEERE
jgi:hypothetical protein